MTSVADICQVLESLAPLSTAESWDNVGLLLGREDRSVSRMMTCLTLTPAVARESIVQNVQLIVTHHPILFRAAKSISSKTVEGRILLDLIEAGVAVYSPHTAFDNADLGINQSIAESLGLGSVEPLRLFEQGFLGGSGRMGVFPAPVPKQEFLQRLATLLSAEYLEFVWSGPDEVHRVGLACGSAAEYLEDARRAGCDTFITGEARFHSAIEGQSCQMNLVVTGHFSSERPAVIRLANLLSERLPDVECVVSQMDRDPLELFRRRL